MTNNLSDVLSVKGFDMSKEVHSPRGSDPLTKLIKHRGIHQVDSCHFSINQKVLNVFSEPLLVE